MGKEVTVVAERESSMYNRKNSLEGVLDTCLGFVSKIIESKRTARILPRYIVSFDLSKDLKEESLKRIYIGLLNYVKSNIRRKSQNALLLKSRLGLFLNKYGPEILMNVYRSLIFGKTFPEIDYYVNEMGKDLDSLEILAVDEFSILYPLYRELFSGRISYNEFEKERSNVLNDIVNFVHSGLLVLYTYYKNRKKFEELQDINIVKRYIPEDVIIFSLKHYVDNPHLGRKYFLILTLPIRLGLEFIKINEDNGIYTIEYSNNVLLELSNRNNPKFLYKGQEIKYYHEFLSVSPSFMSLYKKRKEILNKLEDIKNDDNNDI